MVMVAGAVAFSGNMPAAARCGLRAAVDAHERHEPVELRGTAAVTGNDIFIAGNTHEMFAHAPALVAGVFVDWHYFFLRLHSYTTAALL
jgi:hypothetical protein